MAVVYAIKSGNWSDPTVWSTGALPGTSDDVRSNTFTVNIDGSYTVKTLSNCSEGGAATGGTFNLLNDVTLTATDRIFNTLTSANPGPASVGALTYSQPGGSATINAVIQGGAFLDQASGSRVGVSASGSGTLTVNGAVYAGGAGGNGQGSRGIVASGSVNLNLVGHAIGGNAVGTSSVLNNAIQWSSAGTLNVTGNISGGNTWSAGVGLSSSGNVIVTGNALSKGLDNYSTGIAKLFGITYGSGATNQSTGELHLVGALSPSDSSSCVTGGGVSSNTFLTGPFLTSNNGTQAISVPRWLWKQTDQQPTYMQVRTETSLAIRPLYTADYVGGNPVVANVRSGVTYGPLNELIGTMAVPPADSVGLGVPVDHTVGTQTVSISPTDFWGVPTSSLVASDSIGARLRHCSTPASTAAQVASLV